MKKIMLLFALAGSIFACAKKEGGTAAANAIGQSGITIDSSANTDLVRKSMAALVSGDTATYRSTYSPDVVFHDNLDSMGIDGNMVIFKLFADKGIKVTLKAGPVWENKRDKPTSKGQTNFVLAYSTLIFTRGEKMTKTVIFSIDAIKDGKQIEEWLIYDKAAIAEISK